jgi:hypothetical protein
MEDFAEPREFELPLELQFSMRKAELAAEEMTWDELRAALLNLYYRRLMEWEAVKTILDKENILLEFDVPTDLELHDLAVACMEEDDDGEDLPVPF